MNTIGAGVLVLMGLVAIAASAEAISRGRIWYRPKGTRAREARWIRRSREPVAFWCLTGGFGVAGVTFAVLGVWLFLRPR